MKKILIGVALMMTVIMVLLVVAVSAVEAPRMKMTTEIPKSITTPDRVETRIGSLEFFDGFPTEDTAQKCFDNLDFLRGVETFLNGCPAASLIAMREGMRKLGAIDGTIAITETLMDSKSLFLTPNTESIYTGTWLDLKDGPIVVESPPNTLGIVNDFWFRYVADLGNAGPDKGKGGKYLFVGPGYEGDIPEGYFVSRSQTYGNFLIWRGFLVEGDPKPGIENFKKHARIYPLSRVNDPPEQKWVNMSGKAFNTIHANDFSFYEELNQVVQEEPTESQDPEILGLFASIGIKKGQPFTPDARMKKILTEAAAVGNATVRSLTFPGRDKTAYQYNSGYWKTAFIGGSHEFLADGVRLLDARAFFYYYATMVTPAMTVKIPGAGSQYSMATVDSKATRSMAQKTTNSTIHRMSQPRISGQWWSTTTRLVRCSRPISNTRVWSASEGFRLIWTGPTISTSARKYLKERKATGFRLYLKKDSVSFYAFTDRFRPGSTRPGGPEILNCSSEFLRPAGLLTVRHLPL